MGVETRIRQSKVRIRSGIKLVLIFLVLTLVAIVFAPNWVVKVFGVLTAFFTVTTLVEYWNVWRLSRKSRR
jgi:hypothetical protein